MAVIRVACTVSAKREVGHSLTIACDSNDYGDHNNSQGKESEFEQAIRIESRRHSFVFDDANSFDANDNHC